jgi:phytoene synthase
MNLPSSSLTAPLDFLTAMRTTDTVIRQHSQTFTFATRLLPVSQRLAIRALYAFCRTTDDLVDAEKATVEEMQAWREQVNRPSAEQADPMLFAWALTRETYRIDPRYQDELIAGVQMDLRKPVYHTWEELERYCYLVASTVGLLSMPIIGLAKDVTFTQAAPYAIKLGVALQLTNILRDVGEDLQRGHIYLPEEDLHRFGLTLQDIRNQVFDERFRRLMRFEIRRARQLYHEALPGILLLHPSARLSVGAAALLYRAILDRILAIDFQVYWIRAHTSGIQKLRMLPGILIKILTLKKPCLTSDCVSGD